MRYVALLPLLVDELYCQTTYTQNSGHSHVYISRSGFQRRTFPFLWVPELSPVSATSFSQQQLTTAESQQPFDCLANQPTEINSTDWLTDWLSWAESESYVTTDVQTASLSWNKAPSESYDHIFIIVWQLRVCWFRAPSLTRGRVCRLQLQLALASAVIFGLQSRRTRRHILLSHIWDFPFRLLLRLAGSRWRYSTPPPHGWSDWALNLSCV
jgi:hypothetical protein